MFFLSYVSKCGYEDVFQELPVNILAKWAFASRMSIYTHVFLNMACIKDSTNNFIDLIK